MIQVEDKIIALDIFKKHFVCDLNLCKGACCVEGDAGAPLTKDEEIILKTIGGNSWLICMKILLV